MKCHNVELRCVSHNLFGIIAWICFKQTLEQRIKKSSKYVSTRLLVRPKIYKTSPYANPSWDLANHLSFSHLPRPRLHDPSFRMGKHLKRAPTEKKSVDRESRKGLYQSKLDKTSQNKNYLPPILLLLLLLLLPTGTKKMPQKLDEGGVSRPQMASGSPCEALASEITCRWHFRTSHEANFQFHFLFFKARTT